MDKKGFETGWLCERGEACAPDYLAFAGGRWYWTPISQHALRMARKEDAEAVAIAYAVSKEPSEVDRVAEHSWGLLRCEAPPDLGNRKNPDPQAVPGVGQVLPPVTGCFGTDELCPNCRVSSGKNPSQAVLSPLPARDPSREVPGEIELPLREATWQEFKESGLLWWVNRGLHLFGWALVYESPEESDTILRMYPARCSYRGFPGDVDDTGFRDVTRHLAENMQRLLKDSR